MNEENAYYTECAAYEDYVYGQGYQQGRADEIDDVMKLFNEMRPYLATSVCEFAYRLEQMKGDLIVGNSFQGGEPSPDNPVEIQSINVLIPKGETNG